MSMVEIRANGLKALQQRLKQARDGLLDELTDILKKLGEDAAMHAKDHKGYKDRTANLKNSISYALYYNGEPIVSEIGKVQADAQKEVDARFKAYADANVQPQGFTLIIVAGMSYAAHVQRKGYNVLYLTRDYVQQELKQIIRETIEDLKTRDV